MEAIKKTLSYFMPEEKIEANRREHTRLSGDSMTVIVGETYYDVVNWSEGGISLKASSTNTQALDKDFELTLKFHSGDLTGSVTHNGRVLRKDGDVIVIALEPLAENSRQAFHKMMDFALTESFISSQLN